MSATSFDSAADAVNHIASAVLDLAIPVAIAWVVWIARRALPPGTTLPDIVPRTPKPPDAPP